MLVAMWLRWRAEHRVRLLVVCGVVVVADLVIGPLLIAWELSVLWEMLER